MNAFFQSLIAVFVWGLLSNCYFRLTKELKETVENQLAALGEDDKQEPGSQSDDRILHNLNKQLEMAVKVSHLQTICGIVIIVIISSSSSIRKSSSSSSSIRNSSSSSSSS